MLPYYKRLYKKRANMGLVWYNKNNPVSFCTQPATPQMLFVHSPVLIQVFIFCPQEDSYEFKSMVLEDVYNFMDGGVCYMHMNFKAMNVTTRSEELFFAELALNNSVFDANGGYSTTACSIVDDSCAGMLIPFSLFVSLYTHTLLFFHDWLSRNLKRCIFTSFFWCMNRWQSEPVLVLLLLSI